MAKGLPQVPFKLLTHCLITLSCEFTNHRAGSQLKTKVVQHDPGINIKHLTHWKMIFKWWKTTFSHGRWQELQFSPRTIEFSEYTWKEKHIISQWHQLYRLELFQADWLHHVTSLVLKNVQGPCSLGHIIMLYTFSFHLYAENSMVLGENWNSCLTHWKMTSKWWKMTN